MTQSNRAVRIAAAALAMAVALAPVAASAAGSSGQAAPQASDKAQKPAEPATGSEPDKEGKESKGQSQEDDDLSIDPLQPDFTIITLPTTLRLPRHKGAFRVTHRFGRPLGEGDFGDLLEDFFGLDSGAGLGLEYRFGLAPGVQAAVHRTNGKVVQFLGQVNLMKQGDTRAVGLDAFVAIEGRNNFREQYSPAVGVVLSRTLGAAGAVYVEPIFVGNTPRVAAHPSGDEHTVLLGLGARFRIRPTVYVVGEFLPRVAGYSPREHYATFGLEKRAGGHSFQVNFSNSFWTTFGQMATGGFDDWYLGFNIARKFF